MYAPGLQESLGSEWQLRYGTPHDHIGFVVEKSPQRQKNCRSNSRREAFRRKLLPEIPIRIIFGYTESHLQILLDKAVERGIISNAEMRLGKF